MLRLRSQTMPKSAPLPRDGRSGPVRVIRPAAPETAPETAPEAAPATLTLTEAQLEALIGAAVAATRQPKVARVASPAPVAWSEQERTFLALLGWDVVTFRRCHQFVRKPAPGTVQRDAGIRETPDSVFHRALFAALRDANGTLPAPMVCRLIAALDNRIGRSMKRQPKPEVICSILQQVYGREAYFHRGILTVPSLFKL